jgi:pteridine reductase
MANTDPVALITGGARRLGAAIARKLHGDGFRVIIHYHQSVTQAQQLAEELNHLRADSAVCVFGDLRQCDVANDLAKTCRAVWGRLDCLVNNASSFYPTPLASATPSQWQDLFASNLTGPLFLSLGLADELRARNGTIVNLVDINVRRPLADYGFYCIAKAGVAMMVKTLALELAPQVRVNGIAPGAILWPEGAAQLSAANKSATLAQIPLQRLGSEADIANLAAFLAQNPSYLTGQVIAVDGGLSL